MIFEIHILDTIGGSGDGEGNGFDGCAPEEPAAPMVGATQATSERAPFIAFNPAANQRVRFPDREIAPQRR